LARGARAKRFEQHIRSSDLGNDLAGLYSDYAEVLDAYISLLIQIDKIQSGAVDRANTAAFKNGFSSGVEGAGVYTAATEAGAEGSDATIAALLVGGARFLVKQYEQSKTIEEGKRGAIQAAQKAFKTRVETAFSTLTEVTSALTSRYEWGKSETGLLMSAAEARHFKEVMGGNDDRAILKMLEDLTSARPRDPFVRNLRNATVLVSDDTTVATFLRAAKDSVYAACLVPRGSIYDEYRANTLYLAATMAYSARAKECAAGKDVEGSTEVSSYAVALWDACFEYAASDTTGDLRAKRAWARMANGDLQQALALANDALELQKDQVEFCYQYACLLSRLDRDMDKSFAWLKKAIQQGFYDIAHARRDSDLANLRREKADEFNGLVKVHYDWTINYGVLNDDIVVVNKSAFPLTNVRLSVLIKQGEKAWNLKLTAKAILPGQTNKWENVVSIPGSRCDKASATLNCDQDRE
jgi:hypothetical protein